MKGRLAAILIMIVLLTGCSGDSNELDRVLQLRQTLQTCQECSFSATVTADYGDEICTFSIDCVMNNQGDVIFTVAEPQSISGITGAISHDGGKLTFDDQALLFPILADEQLTPVSAPWVLMQTLRSGYIRSCTKTENGLMAIIDDSYQENSLQLDIWLDGNDIPIAAEILWDGRRVLSMTVNSMTIQ